MSQDWNDGYVSDIEYTHGYYKELSPGTLAFAALVKGVDVDLARLAAPRYLELGFGQGVSLAAHAAAQPGHYVGTDFNPAHAAHCQRLMDAAGVSAGVYDDGFEELSKRSLGQFDVIVFHGIWSWVTDANRAAMLRVIDQHLAPGGLAYCSYNCSPGWDPGRPLRDLMAQHRTFLADRNSSTTQQVDAAVNFAQSVVAADAGFFKSNPSVAKRLEQISKHNKHYLAHEYFNANWTLMGCAEVAASMQSVKLDYVGQVNPVDDDDALQMNADAQALVRNTNNPQMKEILRDYLVNRQFRRDVFVKGRHMLGSVERMYRLNQMRFVLLKTAAQVPMKVQLGAGEVSLKEEIYKPLVEFLASKNFAPKSLAEIKSVPVLKDLADNALIQALYVLASMQSIQPVLPGTGASRKAADAFNAHILERMVYDESVTQLASPVAGCGLTLGSVTLQFIRAFRAGHKTVKAMAAEALASHERVGRRVLTDGKPVDTREAHLAELERLAGLFERDQLALFQALKFV